MTGGLARWADTFVPNARVLLIVNSRTSQLDEIARAIDAIEERCGLGQAGAITPAALRTWLIRRGFSAGNVLPATLHGLHVELGFFLESERAIHWAARFQPDLVLGTESHAPGNEEVKAGFEQRAATLLGLGRFVAHSLPSESVFVFHAEDLWRRAGRSEALEAHHTRVRQALDRLQQVWQTRGATAAPASLTGVDRLNQEVAAAAADLVAPRQPAAEPQSVVDACRASYERLHATTRSAAMPSIVPLRTMVEPPSAWPGDGWLPASVHPVRRPAEVAKGLRWHGTRLTIRGQAEGPYSYLLASRPTMLRAGDAVMAEGHVYHGGITVGLVKGEAWAARVDVDEPGPFLAAAVARQDGTHTLVVANCLRRADRRTAVVLRRFGWVKR